MTAIGASHLDIEITVYVKREGKEMPTNAFVGSVVGLIVMNT